MQTQPIKAKFVVPVCGTIYCMLPLTEVQNICRLEWKWKTTNTTTADKLCGIHITVRWEMIHRVHKNTRSLGFISVVTNHKAPLSCCRYIVMAKHIVYLLSASIILMILITLHPNTQFHCRYHLFVKFDTYVYDDVRAWRCAGPQPKQPAFLSAVILLIYEIPIRLAINRFPR